MHKYTVLFFALWALAPACRAVETKTWTENDQSDFEKGTLTRLSLRNDGRLAPAPVFREIVDTSMPYLWALARDSKGNLYAGGGGPGGSQAKVFVIDGTGKSKVLAEIPGMEIHSVAVNSRDQVFAATAPDGKVYRIGSDGKPEVFYDPHAKYIWAMAFNSKGELFVATGDEGEIHKVSTDGKGAVFFRTEETHARSMLIDSQDNLIVGTEPSGLIVRISPAAEGFVLYQAAKREITAVAVAPDGAIYAAGVGNKTPGAPAPPSPAAVLPIPPASISGGGVRGNAGSTSPGTATQPAAIAGGSEVYRIEKDGAPRKVWTQAQDVVYAISFDSDGKPVVGTGNKGKIYRIDSPLISTLLINALPTQVTNLLAAPGGRIYATTGNVGRLYQIGPELEKQGTYESSAFDAGFFSYWGRLSYLGSAGSGRVTFETRSGNLDRPQKNWSAWSRVDTAGAARIGSPSAQFVQYRATVETGNSAPPEILEVDVAYQQKNVAPVIEEIEITPPNYKFPVAVSLSAPSQNLTLPAMGQHRRSGGSGSDILSSQALTYAKGYAGARWAATDPNGDDLVYTVEIRGLKESAWKPLREKVKERYVSWDSTAFADGEYKLRVTASDAPSNPAGTELKNQLESDRVVIDNTPPQINGLAGSRNGNAITATWKAKDALSEIHKAEYSLDGKDWMLLEPTTRLSDSLEHEYVLSLKDVGPGEHTVAVRVTDDYDNESVEKIVVR